MKCASCAGELGRCAGCTLAPFSLRAVGAVRVVSPPQAFPWVENPAAALRPVVRRGSYTFPSAVRPALPGPPLKPTSRSAPPSASGGSQPTRAAAHTAEVARSAQSGLFAAAPCALRNDESESELEERLMGFTCTSTEIANAFDSLLGDEIDDLEPYHFLWASMVSATDSFSPPLQTAPQKAKKKGPSPPSTDARRRTKRALIAKRRHYALRDRTGPPLPRLRPRHGSQLTCQP
jgi:hypothetical protein